MDIQRFLAISEAVSTALIALTWHWLGKQGNGDPNLRGHASIAGLASATIAIALQLSLAIVIQLRPLDQLDVDTTKGGWASLGGHLWLWSFLATGFLAFGGLALAALGKGLPRLVAGFWSAVALALFSATLVADVNSFH